MTVASDDPEASRATISRLIEARRHRRPLQALGPVQPTTLNAAYALQDLHVQALKSLSGSELVGYKIGCTNSSAQRLLNLNHPFHGRLLGAYVHASPAVLDARAFMMRCIEAEFAFRIGRALPPRGRAYERSDVEAAIAAVMPAIEIVDSRYFDWTKVGPLALVADNGCAGHWVKGEERIDWRKFDLAHERVALKVNGEIERVGKGVSVMDHPLNAMVFLANDLNARGSGLKEGDLVSTGTCIDVWFAGTNDQIVADFGPLGEVSVRFR